MPTDISDLVVHLPERVIFRVNFSLVGALLVVGAWPIRDIAAHRVGGTLPGVGHFFLVLSGLGGTPGSNTLHFRLSGC